MDDLRFDALVRSIATKSTRRHALQGLLGGLATALGLAWDPDAAAARKKRKRKPKPKPKPQKCRKNQRKCNGKCIPKTNCCTSRECKGGTQCKGGKCKCPTGAKVCGKVCIPTGSCCTNTDCDPCETCDSGTCLTGCGPCQECDGGVCTSICGPCQGCDEGECTSTCGPCEECDAGVCTSTCGPCEACNESACASTCGPCDICTGTTCTSTCESGQTCDAGDCVCTTGSCPGCCDDTTCRGGGSEDHCGTGGEICVECGLDQPCDEGECADCDPSGASCSTHGTCCTGRCTCGSQGGHCQSLTFFQGFEQDTENWFNNGPGNAITRVSSGTDGITASGGDWFVKLATGWELCGDPPCVVSATALTRWGGSCMIFPPDGFTTEVDVYLDPDPDLFSGTPHFDFAVALTSAGVCSFHSQFVMRYGKGTLAGEPAFCMSSSQAGTGYGPGANPCQPPVTEDMVVFDGPAGWYTYRHEFRKNASDIVEVTMTVRNQQGVVIGTWLRTGTAPGSGGNGYASFPIQEFPFLAIDNTRRTS